MIREMHDMLARARRRLCSERSWSALAVGWLLLALLAWALWWGGALAGESARFAVMVLGLLAAVAALAAPLWWWQQSRSPFWAAHKIERRHPELGALLLSALEQAPTPRFRRLGYLQAEVVENAVAHGRRHNWAADVPLARIWLARLASLASLGLLVAACTLLVRREAVAVAPTDPFEPVVNVTPRNYDVIVEPGHAEIERGTTLLVVAKFGRSVPDEAGLAVIADAEPGTLVPGADSMSLRPMTRSLDDPQFVGRVDRVMSDLVYHVEYAGRKTDKYRVKVFDYPALERADAKLEFPAFTSLEPKQIDDVRYVTAVEGTRLTLTLRLNKPVAKAELVDKEGESIALEPMGRGNETTVAATMELAESRRYKLQLVDHEGRKNKVVPEFVLKVTPNRPATLKLKAPGSDVRVSPLEELSVLAEASDDYGLVRYGLSYSIGGQEPREVVLYDSERAENTETIKKAELAHLVAMESLQAEPDQLLSYYVWAEDMMADGTIRATMSDMYFAEVRHFEEIFREGEQLTPEQQRQQREQQQQQQGEGGGAAQQAENLAELQKQIVSATWKLVRRETSDPVSDEFESDVQLVGESQGQALEQLGAMVEQLSDSESQAFAGAAGEEMQKARDTLDEASSNSDREALRRALSHEQAAYQALLKLRAREFDVSRQNQQQQQGAQSGGQAGANRQQQQLQQLELSNEENRYETQSRASEAANEAANRATQEARETLNRLRELARRQEDLNERIREMQAALEAAEDEQKREELERELKRLREQQQEMLRDTEELQSEVESSETVSADQQTREQLEEARQRVQQAGEALERGELDRAITEGTRAERGLNELREEFRQRTADRFVDEMRDLRDAARQLDERQQQLAEQLERENSGENRSLRDRGEREALRDGIERQRQELEELLNRIEQTVREAEEPEPLLARELFEAAEGVGERRVQEALELAEQLLDVGVTREAGQPMEAANRGLSELREGIDRAAESVLGDETESLRRAQNQLEELAEQLNREIRRGRGEPDPNAEPREGQEGEQPPGVEQSGGQPRGGQPREGESQEGESQEGESQEGEQPGQRQQPGEGQRQGEGRQPGEGEQPGSGEPREGEPQGERGQQGENTEPREGQGQSAGQPQGEGQRQRGNQGQAGRQQGAGGEGDPTDEQSDEQSDEQPEGEPGEETPGEGRGGQPGDTRRQGGNLRGGNRTQGGNDWGGAGGLEDLFRDFDEPDGPITGEAFRDWDERFRDVEELLDDPELRGEAARIRDRVEAERREYKRHAKEPDWTKLQDLVADPLNELQRRIGEEIRRRESPDSLVPIERDPVPVEFTEKVRRYYERLGSGEPTGSGE